jgi:hypothetical protein
MVFDALAPQEQVEVLRCLVRDIVVHPDKLLLNIFELAELIPGSQKRKDWLPNEDSNPLSLFDAADNGVFQEYLRGPKSM